MKKETTRKTCLKCGHEFTYKEKLQSMYHFWWRMNCSACGMRYNVLMRYRLLFGIMLFVPYIILNEYTLSHAGARLPLFTALGLFLIWIAVLTFVTPLFTALKLDPKEEPVKEDSTAENK